MWRCGACSGIFVESAIVSPTELETESPAPAPGLPAGESVFVVVEDEEPRQALCPADGTAMTTGVFREVQIDVCPHCLGSWLDPEEILKVLGEGYVPMNPEDEKVEAVVLPFVQLLTGMLFGRLK